MLPILNAAFTAGLFVTSTVSLNEPQDEVAVTTYCPAAFVVNVDPVEPSDQEYVTPEIGALPRVTFAEGHFSTSSSSNNTAAEAKNSSAPISNAAALASPSTSTVIPSKGIAAPSRAI